MADMKLNRLEKWIANNMEKALALIEKHIAKDEEVLFYATAKTYPPDILTWIPIIGSIIELSKKNYLLAVTRKNFLMIGIRKFGIEEIAFQSIPVGTIRESAVKRFPLGCNLRLVLSGGKVLLFKDLSYDWASSLKDAIDSAQSGRVAKEPKQAES